MMRLAILSLVLLSFASTSLAADGTVDKARLQAAMQQHIERNLVDGAILHLDTETGQVKPLYPTQAYPMILAMDDYFILCADLRDKDGNAMPLDLYMAPRGRSFAVFHSEIDNRTFLEKLMKDGTVKPLR